MSVNIIIFKYYREKNGRLNIKLFKFDGGNRHCNQSVNNFNFIAVRANRLPRLPVVPF